MIMNFLFLFLTSGIFAPVFAQSSFFGPAFWKKTQSLGPPSSLNLSHINNRRNFTVSWSGSPGNGGPGGCQLEFQKNGTAWTSLSGSYNCDATTSGQNAQFPASDNWTSDFDSTGVSVRLVRRNDNSVMGGFPQRPKCENISGSTVPTPNIDENCNSIWDDAVGGTTASSLNYPAGSGGSANFGNSITCPNPTDLGMTMLEGLDISTSGVKYSIYTDNFCQTPSIGTAAASSGYNEDFQIPKILYRWDGQDRFTEKTVSPSLIGLWGFYGYSIDLSTTACQSDANTQQIQYYHRDRSTTGVFSGQGSIRVSSVPTNFNYSCYYTRGSVPGTYY